MGPLVLPSAEPLSLEALDACDAACSSSCSSPTSDEPTPLVAVLGEQAVLDEHVRTATNELSRELDSEINSAQAWRRAQEQRVERMRAEALEALAECPDAFDQLSDDEEPLRRCQPRPAPEQRSRLRQAAEGDENAAVAAAAPAQPRLASRHGPMVSLGALEADSDAVGAAEASCSDKALAAAITARTEGLRQASEAMENVHLDLMNYSSSVDNILARLQVLERHKP